MPISLVNIDVSKHGEISGSHDGDYEDASLLGRCQVSKVIALMMEAVSTFETSVSFYQTTRRNISEDSYLCV
jgi:hypothetical protein